MAGRSYIVNLLLCLYHVAFLQTLFRKIFVLFNQSIVIKPAIAGIHFILSFKGYIHAKGRETVPHHFNPTNGSPTWGHLHVCKPVYVFPRLINLHISSVSEISEASTSHKINMPKLYFNFAERDRFTGDQTMIQSRDMFYFLKKNFQCFSTTLKS